MEDPAQQQQAAQQRVSSLPGLPSGQYSEAHYRFLASLIEAKSAHKLFEEIALRNYSVQTILAFHRVILSLFNQNAVLADNPDVRVRIIKSEIQLNLLVAECHLSDTQMPSFMNDMMALKDMFADFVSRSRNAQERHELLRTEYGVTNLPSPQQQKEDTGILPFRRGG